MLINETRFPNAGKRVSAQHLTTIKSPAFNVSYPKIRNSHILDEVARQAMEVTWKKARFEEEEIKIFHFKNVYISGECLIFDDQLQIIENVSDISTDTEIEHAVTGIERLLSKGILPHYQSGVVSKRRAASNYGHYLLEMLPMAVVGKVFAQNLDPMYVIHRVSPQMQDVMFRTLRLLEIPFNKLLVLASDEPVHFENLIIVTGLTRHGSYMSPLCVKAVEAMSASIPPGPYQKLFVRRVPGWNSGRSLINQDYISERLAVCGFMVIEPSLMSLEQQVAVFRGAKHIVGVSGAAMTNIVFCQPGTTITMLVPARFPDTFFWFIANHKGLDFTELRAEQKALEGPENFKADFSLSEADIQYIEKISQYDCLITFWNTDT